MSFTKINSPYNVDISFPLAGLGKRFLAWVVDLIIRGAYFWIIKIVIVSLINNGTNDEMEAKATIYKIVLLFLPICCYYLISEIIMNGSSIGKRVVGIKVISLDGYKPTIPQYFNRWIFRLFDTAFITGIILATYDFAVFSLVFAFLINLVSLILIIQNKNEQRIGDLLAGTVVVDLKKDLTLADTVYVEVSDTYVVKYPEAKRLSDRDVSIIKDILVQYYRTNESIMLYRTYDKVVKALNIVPKEPSPELFFERIVSDYNYIATRE
jgi:uncharacterized RDD family membrane protein YckC